MVASVCLAIQSIPVQSQIPGDLFRDNVEPSKGGKVPEAAHMRVELNKLDAAGLESGEGIRMMEELMAQSIVLPDNTGTNYNPGYSPPLKLKPDYAPPPSSPSYQHPSPPSPYAPAHALAPSPVTSYGPAKSEYDAPPYSTGIESYGPPEPAYHEPVGPVLLHKRPYEVKAVQPLPITVEEAYTSFDCRNVPYPGRHYADPESGCEIYHFCHADGKQDSFKCGYGTVFNEYIGTCDYKNNVHCGATAGVVDHVAHATGGPTGHVAAHHAPSPYHDPHAHHFGF